jgi:mono/diheme cytochrome c family protein
MNLDVTSPEGPAGNQLIAWNRLGLFSSEFNASQAGGYPRLARSDDKSRSLVDRARSYLDANCSQCHRPGGTVAYFDARFDTPLEQQLLIDGRVLIDENIDRARVIAPNDPWRSIALARIDTNSDIRMPPLARQTIDGAGVSLIREWIASLPGRPVLAPPVITPAGGRFRGPVQVSLSAEQGAVVRYTLDGSTPGDQDPLYNGPIEVTAPTILRARAYREGYTRSIAVQQNFLADD